jgi:hypothetical protein
MIGTCQSLRAASVLAIATTALAMPTPPLASELIHIGQEGRSYRPSQSIPDTCDPPVLMAS